MLLKRSEWLIVAVNLLYIPAFTLIALSRGNQEFMLYAAVVVAALVALLWKQRVIGFELTILWGLTIWGLMHMAGGNVMVQGDILYNRILIPILPDHKVLKYDQMVHTFGFGVATLACHHLLRPFLKDHITNLRTLAVLVILMGSGVGAANEIVEFIAVVIFPETGVGGYGNTMLDLVFNLVGGIGAVGLLAIRGRLGKAAAEYSA